MKLGYAGHESYRTVIEHGKTISFGINEDTEAVIVESPDMVGPPDLPTLNTCVGVRTLTKMPELLEAFNEQHGIIEAYPATYLYGFLGDTLSDMIEMTFSTRMLTGNIGKQIGFVQGSAVAVVDDITLALPAAKGIISTLKELEYKGEILIGITSDYQICSLEFGHFSGGFALYTELLSRSPQEMYEWCLGEVEMPRLHTTGVAITTMLSYPPFPYDTSVGLSVKAPSSAEKHLYRVTHGKAEIAYVATWGRDIFEAKRRCRKTIDNCTAYNKEIQYRVDYGHGERFVLSHDRWLHLGGSTPKKGQNRSD